MEKVSNQTADINFARQIEAKQINKYTMLDRFKEYKRSPLSAILFGLVILAALITIVTVVFMIGYILIKGIPNIKPELFEWEYNSVNVSMMPAIINTVIMTVLSLLLAVPLGIFSAIYLVEYAKRGNKLVSVIRITAETLSGIPSIVYGLFGYILFVVALGWNFSLISGAITLAIMILPLIIRTTEEALIAVPDSFREGSFGLGAGKLRTVFKIVLPSAVPGILAGVILAIGRIVGESAALIFTAGTVAAVPKFGTTGSLLSNISAPLFSSARTLSVHMYALLSEGLYTNQAHATAVVLLVVVIFINIISSLVAKKLTKR